MRKVKVPDSLLPENILDTVDQRAKRQKIIQKRKRRAICLTAAACGAVCIGGLGFSRLLLEPEVSQTLAGSNAVKNPGIRSEMPADNDYEKVQKRMEADGVYVLTSYDKLYQKNRIQKFKDGIQNKYYGNSINYNDAAIPEMAEDSFVMNGMGNESNEGNAGNNTDLPQAGMGAAGTEFSGTNVRTEGIDEADIIKTDGEYIYYISGNSLVLSILKADGENSSLLSSVDLEELVKEEKGIAGDEENLSLESGCYIFGDTMLLQMEYSYQRFMYEDYVYNGNYEGGSGEGEDEDKGWVLSLNISDREQPVVSGWYEYKGDMLESYFTDGILYLVSQNTIDYTSKKTIPAYVNGCQADPQEVVLMENDCYDSYTVVSAISVENNMEVLDSFIYASDQYPNVYMSGENLYLFSDKYDYLNSQDLEKTSLMKVRVGEKKLEYMCCTEIPGKIVNEFALDEYENYLRVVYTRNILSRGYVNELGVLNENLETVGKISGIAEDETIRSARFEGEKAYFVTYRQTDPLFCVDLSDPENPQIVGYLKIPGYSTYLQSMDETHLLGLGYTDNMNVKVSLFDTSDPENMKEIQTIVYERNGFYDYYAEAADNHRAILCEPEKGIFGFGLTDWYMESAEYIFLTYRDGRIVNEARLDLGSSSYVYGRGMYGPCIRGIYIGDYLYVCTDESFFVYDLDKAMSSGADEKLLEIELLQF